MRPETALVLDEVAVRGRVGIGVQPRRVLVRDVRQLQREEDQVRAALGGGLAYPRQEAARGMYA